MLQAVLLALQADPNSSTTRLTVPATIILVASYVWMLYVSCLEHVRSVRPSTILCLYLGLSSLLDLARTRTVFFIPGYHIVAPIHLASYFVKLVLLAVETTEKRKLLMLRWKKTSPEDAASFYSRVFFVWLNRLFFDGYKTLLTVDTLTPLDHDILASSRPTELQDRWEKGNCLATCPLSCSRFFTDIDFTSQPTNPVKPPCFGSLFAITSGIY